MTAESNSTLDGQGESCRRAGDVPAPQASEEALRASIEELAAVYASVPAAMLLVDSDRRVQRVNAFAARLAGRPEQEMVGLKTGESLRCLHHLDDLGGCGAGPA